jgi:hypothetical protein
MLNYTGNPSSGPLKFTCSLRIIEGTGISEQSTGYLNTYMNNDASM